MANILDVISKQFTILELESNVVFHKDITGTIKQMKERSKDRCPQKNVVNDNLTDKVSCLSRIARVVEGLPFTFEAVHHTSVERRSIAGLEWHDTEAPLRVVRCKETKLLLIANSGLMIPDLVVKGDKIQSASRIAQVIDSVVATRYGIFKWQSALVQATIGDTHTPDKVGDINDVLVI